MIKSNDKIEAALRDGDALDRAILAAHRRVILRHRQLNVPLAIWQHGKVHEVSAQDVRLPEDQHDRTTT